LFSPEIHPLRRIDECSVIGNNLHDDYLSTMQHKQQSMPFLFVYMLWIVDVEGGFGFKRNLIS